MRVVSLNPPRDLESSYYVPHSIHVHKFAKTWALLEITFGILLFVLAAITQNLWSIGSGSAFILVGLTLVIGHAKRLWWLYVPNLVFMVLYIAYDIAVGLLSIFSGILACFVKPNPKKQSDSLGTSFILTSIFSGLLYLFFALLTVYFFALLIRGIQYVKRAVKSDEQLIEMEGGVKREERRE